MIEKFFIKCSDKSNIIPNYHDKGLTFLEEEEYEKALEQFNKLIEITQNHLEDNLDAWYHKGEALSYLGKNEDSLSCFEFILKNHPSHRNALYMKGYVLGDLGKHDEAVEAYNKLLEIDPEDSDALVNKADELIRLNKFDESLKVSDIALELNTSDIEALINKGIALLNLTRRKEALDAFNSAIQSILKMKKLGI